MDVKILRWPSEAHERARYKEMGVPLILFLEGAIPTPPLDVLEDCVQPPVTPEDLRSRADALRLRALATLPVVDPADVLRFGGNWLSLTPTDARLMRVLVDSFQSVVSRTELVEAGWPVSSPRRNAVDLRMLRLRRRICPLDLIICTVRGKGYLLDRKSTAVESPPASAHGSTVQP